MFSRRAFLHASSLAALASLSRGAAAADATVKSKMRYGLVTYMWASDWTLSTLLKNCEQTRVLGVELRSTHKHGVEPSLNAAQRKEVKKRFADSPVELVGLGSNERFDNPDAKVVRKAIDASKAFVRLSADVGGSGVKVKPDRFYPQVPRKQTIQQIGEALNELGEYGARYKQQIRLEVHGQCAEPPTIHAIMQVATNKNVAVCWNSNPQDLKGEGLEANFRLLRPRFGKTLHIRELDNPIYPHKRLIELLAASDYAGWVMLEQGKKPKDPVAELARQSRLFDRMVAAARKGS